MAIRNKFYSLFDSPKQLQEFQKIDRKQVLKVFSLKFVYFGRIPALMGVSLAGKICTRASEEQ